ncbi:metallopeptidase family protein [Kribbia dieselivorans]|uniref:metallopeptidase family protein n=1 Tax=Kribbia dieselivorans TaxID=331526 RepID=UPI000B11A4CE|nr:metallopeptidase family protein [Kribbia dieselivorans]
MISLSEEEFDAAVGDALDSIPSQLLDQMENVAIFIDDEPSAEQVGQHTHGHGGTLLGLYEGVPLTERGYGFAGVLPDRITIFRGPLQRLSRSRAELVRQIRVTVVHEVAHHFGIDDQRLHELGWG